MQIFRFEPSDGYGSQDQPSYDLVSMKLHSPHDK